MNIGGWFRTIAPGVLGYVASGAAMWVTARTGIPVTATEILTIFAPLGHIIGKGIGAVVNPTDAAAPSLAKPDPTYSYTGDTDARGNPYTDPTPTGNPFAPHGTFVQDGDAETGREPLGQWADPAPYAPTGPAAPVVAAPTPAPQPITPQPSTAPQFVPEFVCPFCTGEDGAHYPWCRMVGGSGVAPAGFFDDTRKMQKDFLRKFEAGHVQPEVLDAIKRGLEPERSKILKPKPAPAPPPKASRRKRGR